MTEELKQEAEDYVMANSKEIIKRASNGESAMLFKFAEQAYLASAEPREKQIAELEADIEARKFAMAMSEKVEKQLREQIEKMKCCENCAKEFTENCAWWKRAEENRQICINRQYRIVGSDYADIAEQRIAELEEQLRIATDYPEWSKVVKLSQEDCIKEVAELRKENAELKDANKNLQEFYEKEYFEIADSTADEKIKELEKYQTEVTVDDTKQDDPNSWGMMHEEMFVPKELVRDLLKESCALSEHRKEQLTKATKLLKHWANSYGGVDVFLCKQTQQFLNEVEK